MYCSVIDWRKPKSFLSNAGVPCKKTGCHFLALCGPAPFNLYLCRWASRRVPGIRCHPPLRSGSDSQRERIYREYSQSATKMFNSIVSQKVVQLILIDLKWLSLNRWQCCYFYVHYMGLFHMSWYMYCINIHKIKYNNTSNKSCVKV